MYRYNPHHSNYYRRNADANLRHLEKLAAQGDVAAQKRYYQARWRAGLCHLHEQSLTDCPTCHHGPTRNLRNNVGIYLLMHDLGRDASVYELAQWISDRSRPTHMDKIFNDFDPRICKPPGIETGRAWASFDTIDMAADVFRVVDEDGQQLFRALAELDDWHQFVRITESQNPLLFAQPRPSPEEALAFFIDVVEEILGTITQPLHAIHTPGPATTQFTIQTEGGHQIGRVGYRLSPEGPAEFLSASVHFNYWDGELR